MIRRRFLVLASFFALLSAMPGYALNNSWKDVLQVAKGQTVYWYAWGGDEKINNFIEWVGDLANERYGVNVEHVKLSSTADAVARVKGERDAGILESGAVDLIWINGENFAAMKRENLLHGPFAASLPNWGGVDVKGKPAVVKDFTQPTDGYESPWAMAQLVFEYDSARVPNPPKTLSELKEWIIANPGRFTYPQPPDYLGTTFLKQVAYDTLSDPAVMQKPVVNEAVYKETVAPVWAFLDEIKPYLWRKGAAFPQNESELGQLLADGEIDIGFSFNPGGASAEIAAGNLKDTVRTFIFETGTIGNASFVAIPYNASHKAGALVVANLLLEPEVQAQAQNPDVLGFNTVLDMKALSPSQKELFVSLPLGIATLPPEKLNPTLLEPDSSWVEFLNTDWSKRYGTSR